MHTIPTRQYTREFQEAAVQQVLDAGRSVAEMARSLEMSDKPLSNWGRRGRRGRRGQPVSRRGPLPEVPAEPAELTRLRTENAQLTAPPRFLKPKQPWSTLPGRGMRNIRRAVRVGVGTGIG